MIPTNCSTARRQPAPWFCWSWAVDCPCARLEIFDFFFYIGSIIRRLNSTVLLVSGSELTGVQCEQEGGWAHSPGDFRCWALKLEEVELPLRTVCGLLVRKSDIQLQSVRLKLWVLKFPFVRNADLWVWFPTRHEYWGFRIGGRVGVSIWQVGNDTQKPTLLTNITLKDWNTSGQLLAFWSVWGDSDEFCSKSVRCVQLRRKLSELRGRSTCIGSASKRCVQCNFSAGRVRREATEWSES